MNALVAKPPERMPLAYAEIERLAASIAKSGLFGMKTPDQAMALMMIAHAEGRHPALAARDYDVIQGRPAKKSEAMLRDFLEAGGKVEWHAVTDEKADATFTHPQTGSVRIDWDTKRATIAGLAGKDNYKKFPRQMLRSRVVSEGIRTLWPLATSGLYVPEEVADFTGTTIDHADEPDARDALNAAIPMTKPVPLTKPAVTPVRQERKVAAAHPLDEQDGTKWLGNLESLLVNAQSQDEVVEIAGHHSVGTATAKAPAAVRARISELLADAYGKFPEMAEADASHEPANAA